MGKLISLINVTLDGFFDSQYVNANAEFHEFVHPLLAGAHTVGFGRGSFELFQQVWPAVLANPESPESQRRMAQALNDIDKIAFSTTLKETTWANSRIEVMDAEFINQIKTGSDKNLLTIGSPGFVGKLTQLGIVDEYYFSVQPVIAGGGNNRMFARETLPERQPLQFVDSRSLASGVQILHYRKP
ncbi:dihydrofolate reductase [Chitinophaga terrae (ex Kim and Jung 2007)]|uniref:dihydrofolate reductase family protein n=1 Tax=Chitinophaga terrae (ex Kim and Jung 2007) TaxID=408074 RepID=UPI002783D9E1|nr:dihydrofolate reductase family protein [Chitinophaga terrae (ex Kim and Jung 2007)]MDQ0110403.1 dihydrofolate reductase [Chitinophaga terrae (ex Kim and Jung 2007)]